MKSQNNAAYCKETEMETGVQLTAVSYDRTQTALVTAGRATVGGRSVTAEISGVATGKGEDGTVNLWLPAFSYRGPKGEIKKVPVLNAVARLAPRQGAIITAKTIVKYVNTARTAYKATSSGGRKRATINITFTGRNCQPEKTTEY